MPIFRHDLVAGDVTEIDVPRTGRWRLTVTAQDAISVALTFRNNSVPVAVAAAGTGLRVDDLLVDAHADRVRITSGAPATFAADLSPDYQRSP